MGNLINVTTVCGLLVVCVQVLQVCWDGKLVHLCSLLQSAAAPALLGALADRLLIATRGSKDGEFGLLRKVG